MNFITWKLVVLCSFSGFLNQQIIADENIPSCQAGDINIFVSQNLRFGSCITPDDAVLHRYSSLPYIFQKINLYPNYIYKK